MLNYATIAKTIVITIEINVCAYTFGLSWRSTWFLVSGAGKQGNCLL